ncbi:MAG: hypothetical protein AseanaTS_15890 [Candidatus Pelagadaptatus aseana]
MIEYHLALLADKASGEFATQQKAHHGQCHGADPLELGGGHFADQIQTGRADGNAQQDQQGNPGQVEFMGQPLGAQSEQQHGAQRGEVYGNGVGVHGGRFYYFG